MRTVIATCLWFPGNAEEAVAHYVGIFPNSRIVQVDRYSDVGPDPNAPVVVIEFELNGQPVQAINGENLFPFSEAISLAVMCEDQAEADRYWDALVADGGQESHCGWLKDKFGVSWQVYPHRLNELLRDPDREAAGRAMRTMLGQMRIVMSEIEAAFRGE